MNSQKKKVNIEPKNIQEKEWMFTRKKFIKTLVLSGIAIQLPWLTSCSTEEGIIDNCSPLTDSQFKTVRAVQDILFPDDGNGPSAREINAASYLIWVLNDSRLDPDENNYIIERIDELEVHAKKEYGDYFYELSLRNQEKIIAFISEEPWGKKLLSRLITLLLEALLLDPAYGSNTKKVGWEWLSHDPGQPRPRTEILYPEIFNSI